MKANDLRSWSSNRDTLFSRSSLIQAYEQPTSPTKKKRAYHVVLFVVVDGKDKHSTVESRNYEPQDGRS